MMGDHKFKVGQRIYYPWGGSVYTAIVKELRPFTYALYITDKGFHRSERYPAIEWVHEYCKPLDPIDALIEALDG